MGLICKLFGHKWGYGCRCLRCHEGRDHRWERVAGECRERCALCSMERPVDHAWDGCKCTVCGKERDEGHRWIEEEGHCFHRCAVCGRGAAKPHRYLPVEGQCAERCAVCGHERATPHRFENGRCARCGMEENEAYARLAIAERGQAEALSYVKKITDPEMIKKVILEKGDHYVRLVSVNYLCDDDALAALARDVELDYEIRRKARSRIGDGTLKAVIELEEDPVYRAMADMDIKSGM